MKHVISFFLEEKVIDNFYNFLNVDHERVCKKIADFKVYVPDFLSLCPRFISKFLLEIPGRYGRIELSAIKHFVQKHSDTHLSGMQSYRKGPVQKGQLLPITNNLIHFLN